MFRNLSLPSRGWSVVAAATCINLILGVLYAWGVIGKGLVSQWHWTKAQASLPFTVSTGVFALTMVFAGRCQDRIGPRYVAWLGGLMLGGGLLAAGHAHSPIGLVLTFGLIGGIGIGIGYSATTPPAIKWFPPAKKGLITGLVVSGVGLAAVYMSPLTAWLMGNFGISRTLSFAGAGAIVLVSVLAQFLANPPTTFVPCPACGQKSAGGKSPTARPELEWSQMLRRASFYRLWLMFILSASAGLMLIMHLPLIAREQAHVDSWGFWLVAILALCNTLGRLVSGVLSDRIGRTRTMLIAFFLQALNMFAFSHYTTPVLIIFGAALTGLCYGTIFTLFPAATADFYGLRNLGVNYGLMFTAFGVAGACGPYLAGWIRDSFGSYSPAFMLSGGMLMAGALLSFTVKPSANPAVVSTDGQPSEGRFEPESVVD